MEKITQISKDIILTNKGRLFKHFVDSAGNYFWQEMELPNFKEFKPTKWQKLTGGGTMFVEPVSNKEKFNKAKNIGDLVNE